MTTRNRARTAQIKPATRNAIMDQLACAATEIIWRGEKIARLQEHLDLRGRIIELRKAQAARRWWHRPASWGRRLADEWAHQMRLR